MVRYAAAPATAEASPPTKKRTTRVGPPRILQRREITSTPVAATFWAWDGPAGKREVNKSITEREKEGGLA